MKVTLPRTTNPAGSEVLLQEQNCQNTFSLTRTSRYKDRIDEQLNSYDDETKSQLNLLEKIEGSSLLEVFLRNIKIFESKSR